MMPPGLAPNMVCAFSFWARPRRPMPKPPASCEETYPGLKIVGRRHGYFSRDEEEDICDEINLTHARRDLGRPVGAPGI